MAQHGFGTADPRIVVAEDACVLLVSRRIAGNFAQIQLVAGVGGLVQHHAVWGVQSLLHAPERLRGLPGLPADACHDAHALRLNEDLSLGALPAAHGVAESIVGAPEPCTVPACGQGRLLHGVDAPAGSCGLIGKLQAVTQLCILAPVLDEHACNEHALGHRALAGTGRSGSSRPGAPRSSSGSGSRSSPRGQ